GLQTKRGREIAGTIFSRYLPLHRQSRQAAGRRAAAGKRRTADARLFLCAGKNRGAGIFRHRRRVGVRRSDLLGRRGHGALFGEGADVVRRIDDDALGQSAADLGREPNAAAAQAAQPAGAAVRVIPGSVIEAKMLARAYPKQADLVAGVLRHSATYSPYYSKQ